MSRSVYLDHSASTPTDPRVLEAMLPYFTQDFGNGSSAHRFGRAAERAIEESRESMARILSVEPENIIFTSGGTESDNLAVRGAAWSRVGQGRHLITTPIEHPAVVNTVNQLADMLGFERTLLPVDAHGLVDPEDVVAALRPDTTLVSVVYANNEIGTIQPIPQIAVLARERGVLMHTDAVQAGGQLPLDLNALGVDMLSLSAHKFYGPKGVGALVLRDGVDLAAVQTGGAHENNRRAGTSNTPGIVGMAKALELAYAEFDDRTAHLQAMRDLLIDGVLSTVPAAYLTGHPTQRLPSHASFILDGVDGNTLVMHMDVRGVAVSSGSACKTGNPEPSSVLLALGCSPEAALGSLRMTVGKDTTAEDIEYAVDTLAAVVAKLHILKA
ncbi:MAG: cysteine desulfurase [Chloroflexi bacterium]|uniref:cysteine desulfurase family protein n=1 Tax=Candidatus Flexifilum breve TaxID=3140694 RepID=UPI0031371533|nr:cysteine desulfurase [Chloroflexota bacterium]